MVFQVYQLMMLIFVHSVLVLTCWCLVVWCELPVMWCYEGDMLPCDVLSV